MTGSSLTTEALLSKFAELDGSLLLSCQQTALILGKSMDSLESERKAGTGIPFVKTSDRGAIYYRLGDVRDHLNKSSSPDTKA